MNKEILVNTVEDALQQKTAIATVAAGSGSVATSFMESVGPAIPFMSMVAMIIFGAANVVINWKKYKAGVEAKDGNKR